MGYFGGVNCALLCSFACMSYPKAAPAVVLRQCFRLFSEWAWPSPGGADAGGAEAGAGAGRGRVEPEDEREGAQRPVSAADAVLSFAELLLHGDAQHARRDRPRVRTRRRR